MPVRPLTVPPLVVLLGLLGLDPAAESLPRDEQPVTVPFAVLRLLLRGALACQQFDEERYLSRNPDVASAVLRGDIGSGQEHYAADGYFEGRAGGCEGFAESWYVNRNDDVAAAIRAGAFADGKDHYDRVGMFELRSPSPDTDPDMALWRASRAPAGTPQTGTPQTGTPQTGTPVAAAPPFNGPIDLDAMRRRTAK